MLSEIQAEKLLSELEQELGYKLEKLRDSLLGLKNTKSALWELVLLYASYKTFGHVIHEPDDAHPDVVVPSLGFSLEARLICSPSVNQFHNLDLFLRWVQRKLFKMGLGSASTRTGIKLIDESVKFSTPREHTRARLLKTDEWASFVASIKKSKKGMLSLKHHNIQISVEPLHSKYSISTYPGFKHSGAIEDHPIYRAIEKKGIQLRKWSDEITSKPIVLVICSEDSGSEFCDGSGGSNHVNHAIFSALYSTRSMDPITAYNILGQRFRITPDGLKPPRNDLQVKGATKISAIIFVRIASDISDRRLHRKANAHLYLNAQADRPLNGHQIDSLMALDFSAVEYGPGWEYWEDTSRGDFFQRNQKRGGGWMIQGAKDGFEILIDAISLVQLLSGTRSYESIFGRTEPPSVAWMCKSALEQNQPLVNIELVEGSGQRDEVKIRLTFGPAREATISRSKP